MAFVVTIAQRKGGAGKTTIACQLAASILHGGASVAGIDVDEQGSFTEWAARRQKRLGERDDFTLECAAGRGISSALRRFQNVVDIILIDTPPSLDYLTRSAIRAADLVLTPMQLSPLDLDAMIPTARFVGAERKQCLFVINRAPPRARIADMIRAEIRRQELPLASVEIGNRAAFSESLASGLGVVETAPSGPAAAEMRALSSELMALAGMNACAA